MKICVVGAAEVGKSALISRVSNNTFPAPAEFEKVQRFAFDMGILGIMNVQTTEKRELEESDKDNFDAFIVVFDLTRPATLDVADALLTKTVGKPRVLVASKHNSIGSDLENLRDSIVPIGQHHDVFCFLVSARTAKNVRKPFLRLTRGAMDNYPCD